MKNILILLALIFFGFCSTENDNPKYTIDFTFESFADFKAELTKIALIESETERNLLITQFWDTLKNRNQIPFIFGDSVAFLYKGEASIVSWAGDFNGWWEAAIGYEGVQIGLSNIWINEQKFPSNARLDYKIIVNGNWILDPANPYIQMSGFGPNSELRMPDWVFPQETVLLQGITRGTLSENLIIQSNASNLNYSVQYKVYTPYGYTELSNLPVIYVTDGHEYADDAKGSMIIVLDNLIFSGQINPVIAVFIDPRNPSDLSQNRRSDEYRANIKFAIFVADELVPVIDSNYKTDTTADARAILGTSLGGWNSAYFGYIRSDKFQLIGIHSPAFDDAIIQNYNNSALIPLKIYMSTGVIYDTQDRARAMKTIMNDKGYPLMYKEVNEGHSWGNWRALIDEPLIYFFGN
ncbi:MAG: alpha/beta hydrolase-fold protein [Bacteroidales bacterium]